MKKFEFTLGRMLSYQQTLLDKEKGNLAAMYARRNELEASRDAYHGRYLEACAIKTAAVAKGVTALEFACKERDIVVLRDKEKEISDRLLVQEQKIEKQRQIVMELSQKVAGYEKLRDKQWDEYQKAQQKAESEQILEMVSGKLVREGL